MGTRADFYVGRGKAAEWLGSIAWDGYRGGLPDALFEVKTEQDWRVRVTGFITSREDGTLPKDGWPWPWEDSNTTDCAYSFAGGKAVELETDGSEEFPNMKDRQKVRFDKGSGLMIMRAPKRDP